MLQRFLLFWLIALSGVALWWPTIVPGGWPDPFVASKDSLGTLIAATMFAIGAILPRDEVRQLFKRLPIVGGGTAVQYLSMPLLAYIVARIAGFDRDTTTGIVLVGCVPGAMASNVLTLAAGGNASYSVSLTTLATLISPVAVPLTLKFLIGTSRPLDVGDVSGDLLLQVVLPVVAGHAMAVANSRFATTMKWTGPALANLSILWIVAVVVGLNRTRLMDVTPWLVVALLLVNLLGYAFGFLGGTMMKLDTPMRRALTLEVGMQNAGLGTFLAIELFPDNPAIAIPTAAYTFGCMLTGTILAAVWNRSASRGN